MDLERYLNKNNFNRQYQSLIKKYIDKKIIIYGAGQLFETINSKYNLSCFRIKGVSDKKFDKMLIEKNCDTNGMTYEFLGYKAIDPKNLYDEDMDILFIATLKYHSLVEFFKNQFKNRNVKVLPFVKESFLYFINQVFNEQG